MIENLNMKQLKLLWYCKMRKSLEEIVFNFNGNYSYLAWQMQLLYRQGLVRRTVINKTVAYLTPFNIVERVEESLKYK